MQVLDIIISILLVIGLIGGLTKGVVKQIASLAGLIAGILIGKALYMPVGDWLVAVLGSSLETSRVVAFIAILIIVPLLFSIMGWLIAKILHAISLGWLNRLLGAVVGVAKYALLAGIIITAIEFFDRNDTLISEANKTNSIFYYPLFEATNILFDNVKEDFQGTDDWVRI